MLSEANEQFLNITNIILDQRKEVRSYRLDNINQLFLSHQIKIFNSINNIYDEGLKIAMQ